MTLDREMPAQFARLDAAAEAEIDRLLAGGPDCLGVGHVLGYVEGGLPADDQARAAAHLAGCTRCAAEVAAYRQRLASLGPPAEVATETTYEVASLFARGVSLPRIIQETGLSPEAVASALFNARNRGLVTVASRQPPRERRSLQDLLRMRGTTLRHVHICRTGPVPAAAFASADWNARIQRFGEEIAPLLVALLAEATCVGVCFGKMVAAAIDGLRGRCGAPPARERGPLYCVATAGGLVGVQKFRPDASSSILASRLTETINGNWDALATLIGVEGFIASYLGLPDEVEMTRRRIACFPNYQAIFGTPGQPGLIDQADALLTSCGNAHHYSEFWRTELARLGVSAERVNTLTEGNIGGVLLARDDLSRDDRVLIDDINRRWTGITRRHVEQVVRREPGVILLALRHNKADVVLKCVELGLVSELILDEDLALAIWDLVDPDKRYERTLDDLAIGAGRQPVAL